MSEELKNDKVVIPKPPIPSKVRSNVLVEQVPSLKPETVNKVDKVDKVDIEYKKVEVKESVEIKGVEVGSIRIRLFNPLRCEVRISGNLKGAHLDLAWRSLMKQYRLWKRDLYKEGKHKLKIRRR